jgi:hypothetical protein
MRKGTTKIQNIQLLKWCAEFGIWAGWNYLYGFPGEREDEIAKIADQVETIHHLQPPSSVSLVRMDRFSPYCLAPGRYGLEPTSPAEPYRHIYPGSEESLSRIAYFFQSDFFLNVSRSRAFKTCQATVKRWQEMYPRSYLLAVPGRECLVIVDSRPCAQRYWRRLAGVRRRIYEYCDKARTVTQIRAAVGSLSDQELRSILAFFVRVKLMLQDGDRFLSLAVRSRPNCGKVARYASGGYIKPLRRSERLRRHLVSLVTLRTPPAAIVSAVARRASVEKNRVISRTVSLAAKHLSAARRTRW